MSRMIRAQRMLPVLWIAGVSIALAVLFAGWRYDDPYITYRYAENLARGSGFVYNAGERVLSTTAPAFAILLAAVRAAGWPDLHAAAVFIGAVSIGVGAGAAHVLALGWGRPRAAWALLLLYPASLLLLQTLSSETPLFLALSLVALAAYARGRWMTTAIAAAAAVLVRGDGVLLVGLLCVDYLWKSRVDLRAGRLRVPWAALAVFAVVVGVWAIWATMYFGAPFPVTLAAKRAQGLMTISTSFFAGLSSLPRYIPEWLRWPELAAAAFGIWTAVTRRRAALLPILWIVAYIAAYSVLGVTRYFWYYAPIMPGFVLCLALGLDEIFERIELRYARIGFGALLGVALVGHAVQIVPAAATTDPRYSIYRAAGAWLRENTPPEARIGMLEVGIIGYYAERPVVDFAGLLQPDVVAQIRPASTYDDLAIFAIERYRPDWLVLIDGALPQSEAHAVEQCALQKRFPALDYAAKVSLSVWRCTAP